MFQKFKILTICLFILFLGKYNAQAQTYSQQIATIFQHVDFNKVPSGILQEVGIHFQNPARCQGTITDSSLVNLSTWRALYAGMYSSQVRPSVANLASLKSINFRSFGYLIRK